MIEFIIFIFFIYFLAVYIKKTPSGVIAVIKRSGKYLKTVEPNTSYFFNPKTDVVTLVNIKPQKYSNILSLLSNDRKTCITKLNFTFYVIDPIKVAELKYDSKRIINEKTEIVLKNYVSQRSINNLENQLNSHTLKLHDLLNTSLNTIGISAKNISLQLKLSENSSSTKTVGSSSTKKVPCIHKDEEYTLNVQRDNYSTSKNDIDEAFIHGDGAIKNYDLSNFRNNPIKESISIKNSSLYTLENEDSNVDPIKNI